MLTADRTLQYLAMAAPAVHVVAARPVQLCPQQRQWQGLLHATRDALHYHGSSTTINMLH